VIVQLMWTNGNGLSRKRASRNFGSFLKANT
jgi:hypothetical protein